MKTNQSFQVEKFLVNFHKCLKIKLNLIVKIFSSDQHITSHTKKIMQKMNKWINNKIINKKQANNKKSNE